MVRKYFKRSTEAWLVIYAILFLIGLTLCIASVCVQDLSQILRGFIWRFLNRSLDILWEPLIYVCAKRKILVLDYTGSATQCWEEEHDWKLSIP